MADRDADAQATDIESVRLDVTSRVKQAYFRLAASWAITDALTRNRDRLTTLLAVSETRYAVSNAAQQDVIKAQTQLSILELQLERARQERFSREGELKALLGRPYTDEPGTPAPWTMRRSFSRWTSSSPRRLRAPPCFGAISSRSTGDRPPSRPRDGSSCRTCTRCASTCRFRYSAPVGPLRRSPCDATVPPARRVPQRAQSAA